MTKNNLGYLVREGFRGLFLHGFRSFTAICVTVACLIIMGSFCLLSYNLDALVKNLENENRVLVYIDEDYSTAEAMSVGSRINLIANVQDARFISREEALQNFIAEQDDASAFDGLTSDTLRDRFSVSLSDNSKMKQTVSELEELEGVAGTSAHYEISEGFQTIRNVLNFISLAVTFGLLVVSLFIISNTVKLALYDRKEEIAIMRVVGATNGFIRFPFLIEGLLLGAISAIAAFFLEWLVYDFLSTRINAMDVLHLFAVVPFYKIFPVLAAAFACAGFLVGVLGSLSSIRKFLQV